MPPDPQVAQLVVGDFGDDLQPHPGGERIGKPRRPDVLGLLARAQEDTLSGIVIS